MNNRKHKQRRQRLRNKMPLAETILWQHLKGKKLKGYKFRRQHGVGSFILDFYCPSANLAIELDGDSHFELGAEEYDNRRQMFIESKNIVVIRFKNFEVFQNLDHVLQVIVSYLES